MKETVIRTLVKTVVIFSCRMYIYIPIYMYIYFALTILSHEVIRTGCAGKTQCYIQSTPRVAKVEVRLNMITIVCGYKIDTKANITSKKSLVNE